MIPSAAEGMIMKRSVRLVVRALFCFAVLTVLAIVYVPEKGQESSAKRHTPELEYLKSVNSVAPLKDPDLLFVLMTQFANSNLQGEGAEFFRARLQQFEPQLSPVQKSLHLGIIVFPRAEHTATAPRL